MSGNKEDPSRRKGRGLNRELHSVLTLDNVNLLKFQGRRGGNPYLQDLQQGPVPKKRVSSHWYAPGEIVSHAEELRRQEAERLEEEKRSQEVRRQQELEHARLVEAGEIPAKHEEVYLKDLSEVPEVEWWDLPFIGSDGQPHKKYAMDYSGLDPEEESDSEDEADEDMYPSIRYIQHPVPIEKPRDTAGMTARIFLTKKEQRKARRNNRKLLRQEKEEKIKLGLEPKPEPKVKLANMMSVYENDANVADPTQWEAIVRQQVADRKRKHMEENERRHQESVKRRKQASDSSSSNGANNNLHEYSCVVYMFDEIKNPSVRYKLKMNAKQLKLKGCCLHIDDGRGILIALGDEKSIRFFDKLVTRRINWNEPYTDKTTNEVVHWNGNLKKVWNGLIGPDECKFRGWFMLKCNDSNQLTDVLRQQDATVFLPSGVF